MYLCYKHNQSMQWKDSFELIHWFYELSTTACNLCMSINPLYHPPNHHCPSIIVYSNHDIILFVVALCCFATVCYALSKENLRQMEARMALNNGIEETLLEDLLGRVVGELEVVGARHHGGQVVVGRQGRVVVFLHDC